MVPRGVSDGGGAGNGRQRLEEGRHCGQHHGPVSGVDVAGLAASGDRVVGEQFAVAVLPGVLTTRAEHRLKGKGTVGACAVRQGPLTHRMGVGQLGDAGQVVGHYAGGGVTTPAAWSGA